MRKLIIFFMFLFVSGVLTCKVDGDDPSNKNPSIHVFIHVCTINHWQEVLERQLSTIKTSGLYEQCDSISLGILGDGDISSYIERYPKLSILFQQSDVSLYERPTILSLHKLCESNPNALVLYLHTKGVSHSGNTSITDWSRYMEYFTIECWRDCVKELKQGYDVCGVNWRLKPRPHFSGNFWWATAKYIATLPNSIGSGYLSPEMWIGLQSPNAKCFYESNTDHYRKPYPESEYKDKVKDEGKGKGKDKDKDEGKGKGKDKDKDEGKGKGKDKDKNEDRDKDKDPQYVLVVIPEDVLGDQLEKYWNKVKNSDLQHKFVMNAPPHCKLTTNFTSMLTKAQLKQAIQKTLNIMISHKVPKKIRVAGLVQGKQNEEKDYLELKSAFLKHFAKEFVLRQNLPMSIIMGKNQPLHITLRMHQFSEPHKFLRIQKLQSKMNLDAQARWSICIYKVNKEKLELLTSCPVE